MRQFENSADLDSFIKELEEESQTKFITFSVDRHFNDKGNEMKSDCWLNTRAVNTAPCYGSVVSVSVNARVLSSGHVLVFVTQIGILCPETGSTGNGLGALGCQPLNSPESHLCLWALKGSSAIRAKTSP